MVSIETCPDCEKRFRASDMEAHYRNNHSTLHIAHPVTLSGLVACGLRKFDLANSDIVDSISDAGNRVCATCQREIELGHDSVRPHIRLTETINMCGSNGTAAQRRKERPFGYVEAPCWACIEFDETLGFDEKIRRHLLIYRAEQAIDNPNGEVVHFERQHHDNDFWCDTEDALGCADDCICACTILDTCLDSCNGCNYDDEEDFCTDCDCADCDCAEDCETNCHSVRFADNRDLVNCADCLRKNFGHIEASNWHNPWGLHGDDPN